MEFPSVPESNDPWLLENQFFGNNPPHRLRDAFLDYLRAHRPEYEEIERRRPQGSLAVSYVRGSKKNSIEESFDYVCVLEEIEVADCSYDYQGATAAGSDHGIVTAELRLHR